HPARLVRPGVVHARGAVGDPGGAAPARPDHPARAAAGGGCRRKVTPHTAALIPDAGDLPARADVLEALRREVTDGAQWRWLELSCSLAAGRGDPLSDIDAGVGYAESLAAEELDRAGTALVEAAGATRGVLIHALPGWPPGVRRFAVEYASG